MVDPLIDGSQAPDNEDEVIIPTVYYDEDYEAEQSHNNYEEDL